jgi:hypothetical protein
VATALRAVAYAIMARRLCAAYKLLPGELSAFIGFASSIINLPLL